MASEDLHRYCRDIEGTARRHCARLNLDPDASVEMPWPQNLQRWQLVAGDLLKSFSERFPPDVAEMLRSLGYEYILAGSARGDTTH